MKTNDKIIIVVVTSFDDETTFVWNERYTSFNEAKYAVEEYLTACLFSPEETNDSILGMIDWINTSSADRNTFEFDFDEASLLYVLQEV